MMGYTVLCSPVHHLRHHHCRRRENRYHFLAPHFHFDSTEYKSHKEILINNYCFLHVISQGDLHETSLRARSLDDMIKR